MGRKRLLAVVLLAAMLVSALAGLALAGSKRGVDPSSKAGAEPSSRWQKVVGQVKPGARQDQERADGGDRNAHREKAPERDAPEKKAPAPRSKTVEGVLVAGEDGFVLVATGGEYAFRVAAREGFDLAAYAWKRVQARLEAREGQWVVVAVKKAKAVRFVAAPEPKAKKPAPQPAPEPEPQPEPQPQPQLQPQPEPAPAPAGIARVD